MSMCESLCTPSPFCLFALPVEGCYSGKSVSIAFGQTHNKFCKLILQLSTPHNVWAPGVEKRFAAAL